MSTITEEKRKHFLTDVAAIRLSLIVLLVVYHAFCIYTGAWDSPFPEDAQISAYKWLGMIIHCFQLETMVFISGYLLGFQSIRKPDALSVHACVVRKAKRILLPCLLFGVVYYVMFYDLHAPWYTILLRLLGGCGHLWFLPMIFWCFVFVYLISKVLPPPNRQKREQMAVCDTGCVVGADNCQSFWQSSLRIGKHWLVFPVFSVGVHR